MNTACTNIEDYINSFPQEIIEMLQQIRATIRQTAPEAAESISYGMPAYKLNGKALVYFASYKSHIGFYATPQGHQAFAKELSKYKQGKGSVQFPLTAPMPLTLIAKIVKYKAKMIMANNK